MKLENKVSLITGSSRGIGKAIALAYAREGSDIAINYSTSLDAAKEVAGEIEKMGRRSIIIKADVASKSEIDSMVGEVIKEFGKIDVLVNNAGMGVVGTSLELEESRWKRGMDVMLSGVFFCSQAVGREMVKRKTGRIINIASVVGIGGFPERACYASAKAGVIQLTKVLGCEWAKYNINVNAIAPGYIKTDILKGYISSGAYSEDIIKVRTPLGRMGEPEEIADMAMFLASDESAFMTCQTITVDGGWNSYNYLQSWLEASRNE